MKLKEINFEVPEAYKQRCLVVGSTSGTGKGGKCVLRKEKISAQISLCEKYISNPGAGRYSPPKPAHARARVYPNVSGLNR